MLLAVLSPQVAPVPLGMPRPPQTIPLFNLAAAHVWPSCLDSCLDPRTSPLGGRAWPPGGPLVVGGARRRLELLQDPLVRPAPVT
jgi:hypothetical protein